MEFSSLQPSRLVMLPVMETAEELPNSQPETGCQKLSSNKALSDLLRDTVW
jgi:hypothetical protein